jgi:predicted dehydrogenase
MEKIRVGVIGTGFATAVQIPGFQHIPDVEVVAVCSARMERAEAAALQFNIPHAFTDYRQMLDLPGLDMVSIVTPPWLHYEMTLAAIDAGKHVLCEKPLAMNASQAKEMYDRARAAGVVHMVTHEFRFAPARRYAKDLIDRGYIGDLGHVQINLFVRSPGPYPRPWTWAADPALGGGFLGALGSHYIDALRMWFGDFTEISGTLMTIEPERVVPATNEVRKSEAEDTFTFTGRFRQGGQVSMSASNAIQVGTGARIEIYGTEGTLVLDQGFNVNPPVHGKLLGCRRGESELHDLPVPDTYIPFEIEGDNRIFQFVMLVHEFLRGIREGVPVAPSLYDGLRCQQVLDAIRVSSATRQWVTLPVE